MRGLRALSRLSLIGTPAFAASAVFALSDGVAASGRAVHHALAAVIAFRRAALLVDKQLLGAVLVATDEVVSVRDDVVEELECADL